MADNNELERTLWAAADKMRSNMDAAEYKHVVLGLIFLKYISDAFNDLYEKLKEGKGEFEGADPEDADEYLAHNIFFVSEKARWQYLQDRGAVLSRTRFRQTETGRGAQGHLRLPQGYEQPPRHGRTADDLCGERNEIHPRVW